MPQTIQLNDDGTQITITVTRGGSAWNISTATFKEIEVRWADGSLSTLSATFVTSGSNGEIYATLPEATIVGPAKARAVLTVGTWSGATLPGSFVVSGAF